MVGTSLSEQELFKEIDLESAFPTVFKNKILWAMGWLLLRTSDKRGSDFIHLLSFYSYTQLSKTNS